MFDPSKIKLGISPINWTNDDMPELGGEIPFEQCIREMRGAGFVGTEVGSRFPKDPAKLKEALAPYHLQIAGQWFSTFFTTQEDPTQNIEDFKKRMAFLKEVGAKVIVISEQGRSIQGQMETPLFENKPVLDMTGWDRLVDGLHKIGKIALDKGMKIAYHPHMGTVIQTRKEISKLMSNTNPELVWLLVDTGHIYFSDGDPVASLRDYSDRIAHIHLKDVRDPVKERVKNKNLSFLRAVKEGVFTVPGDGAINFAQIFEEIRKSEYEGWLIVEAEQDPAEANPLEYAKRARKYVGELTGL